ncbi:MAG: hypothetical protein AAGF59_09620, partial [Pseudomonadota bacterium]
MNAPARMNPAGRPAGLRALPLPSWTTLAVITLVCVILFATHSFTFLFANVSEDGMVARSSVRSSPIYLAFFASTFGLVLLLVLVHLPRIALDARTLIAAAIMLLVLTSMLWSVSASTTLANGVLFCFLVLASYVFAVWLTPSEFVRIYFKTAAILLLISFFVLLLMPEWVGSLRGDVGWLSDYQFRGVVGTKTRAGIIFVSVALGALFVGMLG